MVSKEEAIHRFGDEFSLGDVPYLNDDVEVVLAAVKKDGSDIQYASPRLQMTTLTVFTALRQNGLAYRFLTPQIKTSLPVIQLAQSISPGILEFVPDAVWEVTQFLEWVANVPNAIIPQRHKQKLKNYRDVFEHVEYAQVRRPMEFTQDCVCFVKGHSNFTPSNPIKMNEDMKHKTLLIADPCDICILFQEPAKTYVTELFSHPEIFRTSPEDLLDQVNALTKEQSDLDEKYKTKGDKKIKIAEIFKKSKGYISTDETSFINRRWMFTDKKKDRSDTPSGFIFISYMHNGEIISEYLFVDEIETATFTLTKKALFDFLYEKGIRNVILIDGGCSDATTCSPEMIASLRQGKFGGKSKKNKKKSKKKSKILKSFKYSLC